MGAYVSPPDRDQFGTFLSDTTDENGRAYALVQLGVAAGTAAIVVTVPDIGAEDTAHFTVKAGSPASVIALPQDTALYVGRSFSPRSTIVDSYQNPVEGPVTYRVIGSAVTFADGNVSAVQLGRGLLIASFDVPEGCGVVALPGKPPRSRTGPDPVAVWSDGGGHVRGRTSREVR